MPKRHSDLNTSSEIHNPKGFAEADNGTVLTKNGLGLLQYQQIANLMEQVALPAWESLRSYNVGAVVYLTDDFTLWRCNVMNEDEIFDEAKWSELSPSEAFSTGYVPADLGNWDGGLDPENVKASLDQLAERAASLENAPPGANAAEIAYTPSVLPNWDNSQDPGQTSDALDQLAARTKEAEGRLDLNDSQNAAQDARLSIAENRIDSNDTSISNLNSRVVTAEDRLDLNDATNALQDNRFDNIENVNNVQDSRLSSVEVKNTEQDLRLDVVEAKDVSQDLRLDAVETKDSEQDGRLDSVEAKDVVQDGRLDAVESTNTVQDSRLTTAEERIDAVETVVVNVRNLSDFPVPDENNLITLLPNTTYRIIGNVNIGNNKIKFSETNAIIGENPQKDILEYTGTDVLFEVVDVDFIIDKLGISCPNGIFVNATNIDYSIDPAVNGFQGRNKRFTVTNSNLSGGSAGLGSTLGEVEGFGTINFNANLIRFWDDGIQVSNGLSFEALNNKSVLWNGQGNSMIILRDNNWSGQTDTVGSYIPTGFNAFNFNGNILHPRTTDFAVFIEPGHSTQEGNISGNIFINTGATTGAIFNPNSLGYNDLGTYNIQGNQGIADNTPTIQITSDVDFAGAGLVTTIGGGNQNVDLKLNFGNTIQTTENLLFSSRLLVTNASGFQVNEIITGITSGYTAKIESIDTVNNYIYVEFVVDGNGDPQFFTVGETITGADSMASTVYNGVDGTFKYYGIKPITARILATISLDTANNNPTNYRITPFIDGVGNPRAAGYTSVDGNAPVQVAVQLIQSLEQDSIIELFIANLDNTSDAIVRSITWNISGR